MRSNLGIFFRLIFVLALFNFLSPFANAAKKIEAPVYVGAYINDIHQLDLKGHNFGVDLYVWYRWSDPSISPTETFEFINPFELWGHTSKADYQAPQRLPSGEFYQVVRTNGRFTQKFALDLYPFDTQILSVAIEDTQHEKRRLQFLPDTVPIRINPKLRLPGYEIGAPELRITEHHYDTDFGDPRILGQASIFSRIEITVPVKRPRVAYAIKFLLPILCVVFAAALMFLFHPNHVDSRVGIGITALLTIVALQITLNEDLPEIDYLVLIDKIYLSAYLYVIAGLAIIVKTTAICEKNQAATARAVRIDRVGLACLTVIYLLTISYLLLPVIL